MYAASGGRVSKMYCFAITFDIKIVVTIISYNLYTYKYKY